MPLIEGDYMEECKKHTDSVFGKGKQKEIETQRLKDFNNAFNVFSEIIEVNAPFIPEDIYEMFVGMRKLAYDIANHYEDIKIEKIDEQRGEEWPPSFCYSRSCQVKKMSIWNTQRSFIML